MNNRNKLDELSAKQKNKPKFAREHQSNDFAKRREKRKSSLLSDGPTKRKGPQERKARPVGKFSR
jgi:hypothetical protein